MSETRFPSSLNCDGKPVSETGPYVCFSFEEQLQSASEHLACYLEPRDKEVLGTTYKDLRTMIESIHSCGYFDQPAEKEEEPAVEAAEEEEVEGEAEQPQPDTTQGKVGGLWETEQP